MRCGVKGTSTRQRVSFGLSFHFHSNTPQSHPKSMSSTLSDNPSTTSNHNMAKFANTTRTRSIAPVQKAAHHHQPYPKASRLWAPIHRRVSQHLLVWVQVHRLVVHPYEKASSDPAWASHQAPEGQ